jgi:hypothetical protein
VTVLTTSSLNLVGAFVVRFPLVTALFAFLGLDFGFGELLTGLLLTLLFAGEPLFATTALVLFDFDFAIVLFAFNSELYLISINLIVFYFNYQ